MNELNPINPPQFPDNKTQFTQQFFEPAKKSQRGYVSDEVAFEIGAEEWQKRQGHPLPFKQRAWRKWRNGR